MSKSKKNGVDPMQEIQKWGADTTRLFVLFKAPPEKVLEWDSNSIAGPYRFLTKLWSLVQSHLSTSSSSSRSRLNEEEEEALSWITNKTISEVTNDFNSRSFNTAVSNLMKVFRFRTFDLSFGCCF
eukprot:TRINITY_DN1064_c0_g2_i3.p1 TRINITY_DN1064_c0_g2~~TRINITY_DN1064_c0_g2_i3.p1  ORF type:complete len:148 (-),score=19.17 TRINITY_DN1064_c0_g2_i3:311-688(-)